MNCQFVLYHNTRIPMRDGITLAADIYLPNQPGKFPVVLTRSPYGGTVNFQNTDACKEGYAVVWVDCRGRFLSDGICSPCVTETDDGYDTLEWLQQQEWCNGSVYMVGGSYPGLTQLTAAASGHPALKAAAPSAISSDMFEVYYTHGVLELSFMPSWHIGCMCSREAKLPKPPDWQTLRKQLPVAELDERAGIPCPSWKAIAGTPDPSAPLWQKNRLKNFAKNIHAPFFIQTSYFDLLGRRGPNIYTDLMSDPETPESFKKHAFLRIGPWGHGVNTPEGEYTFGKGSMVTEAEELDFLRSLTSGKEPETDKAPGRIQYFTMGENQWHYTDVWPVANAEDTTFYFGSRGKANTAKSDGWLTSSEPGNEQPADTFAYDPQNPVPSCGGRMVGAGGQKDQSEVEKRQDVLVYTSPKLAEDVTITGMVKARLFVQSTAPDTDFTVKLVDVQADGRPMNICDTIYRMRYRNGYKAPVMMKPGETYEVEFDVDYTSYQFKKGNSIRVEISSSNFPHYERNLNTEVLPANAVESVVANQTVHHAAGCASCIILPVVKP